MKVGDFLNRIVIDFFTSESFWHNELTDLLKMFPFLYTHLENIPNANSKKKYYDLYPIASKSQDEAFHFLSSWLKLYITSIESKSSHRKKMALDILDDMEKLENYFATSSIVRRRALLARWNMWLVQLQMKYTKDKTRLILSGVTMLSDKIISILAAKKKLEALEIKESLILDLPDSIEKLKKIKSLKICNTELVYIPLNLLKLKLLEDLSLINNKIKYIPNELSNLTKLKKLDLSGNKIKSLPDSKKFQKFLDKLKLSADQIIESQNTENTPETLAQYWAKRLEQQSI